MQSSFIDLDNRYAQLSKHGDPLDRLNAVIDWKIFRLLLARIDAKERKSTAGRKPTDRILMFKLLILQRMHNLADERLEFQLRDRLSFMRFLGLGLEGVVPDARTVWAFRQELVTHQLIDELFAVFNQALAGEGIELKSGQIIDATFVPVPMQRNTREENAQIKEGQRPSDWGQTPRKVRHKDEDARWSKKGGKSHYGYKNHINIDADKKIITKWASTDASVHDSQMLKEVVRSPEDAGKPLFGDGAYRGDDTEQWLKAQRYDSFIHERAYKDKPLSKKQKALNKKKSSVRSRVEHVFGHMRTALGGTMMRSIGAARAKVNIGLLNLTYNLSRVEYLIRSKVFKFARVRASSAD